MNNNIKMMEMQIEKIAKKKFEYWKEEFVKKILEEIGESINFQKDLLKEMPESQFHIGRIQGLSKAEDIIKTKSGFKE